MNRDKGLGRPLYKCHLLDCSTFLEVGPHSYWFKCSKYFCCLFQVFASDKDSEPNAKLTYYIVGGDINRQFTVDPKEGIIRVVSPLDRETVS